MTALTVCIGVDPRIVLRDLRGLTHAEAEEVARWPARSLPRVSLAEKAAVKAAQ